MSKFWKFVWKVFLAILVINLIWIAIIIILALLSTSVSATPEPSFGFKASQWFDTTFSGLAFSLNSDYQSFTKYNTNTQSCVYYTGICESVASKVVDAKNCVKKDGTKEFKTLSDIDKQLDLTFGSCTPKGNGGIGETCTTADDCGLACQGKTNCEPRCLFSGTKRICLAGDKTGEYATICAANSDCEPGEACQNGMCTTPNYNTGNPTGGVTKEDICTVVNCNTKCTDGTPVGQCSEKSTGLYCAPFKANDETLDNGGVVTSYEPDPKHNSASLIAWSGICGCPEGDRPDFNGRTCCTPPTCLQCIKGEVQTKVCPNGEEIITSTCGESGYFDRTDNACKVETAQPNVALYIFLAVAILFLVGGGGLLLLAKKKRKR